VIWLDDLERYLGAAGLTPGLLDRLMPGTSPDAVMICTMRVSEYERFTNRAEPDINADDRAAWRASRGVLRRARVVFADRLWSGAELARAAEHRDDLRIARALDHAMTFGVAETLTAGPVLVRDWRNARSPGAHPRGAALVTAAVDCRRAGMDVPVTRALVEELHEHYLTMRGGHALRPEDLAEAWRWAL
jgi:eukaryotic-like serine/threonine-protein kinase